MKNFFMVDQIGGGFYRPFSLTCINMGDLITGNNGSFKPGNPGGPGRGAGTPNKFTKTVKEAVLAVFQEIQEDDKLNLKAFADKYPRDFYQIAAKLIPTDIRADVRLTQVKLQIVRNNTSAEVADPAPEPTNGTE